VFQRKHVQHVRKDSWRDASRLLGPGRPVCPWTASRSTGPSWTRLGAGFAFLVTADQAASACPNCGVVSVSLKGLFSTRPRDIPMAQRDCVCSGTSGAGAGRSTCLRSSFTESVPAVRARSWLTTRLCAELGGCGCRAAKDACHSAAAHCGASWPIAHVCSSNTSRSRCRRRCRR
jgi:hypothetical protein